MIVEIRSGRRIPQVTVHGRAPLVRTTLELPHAGLIGRALAGGANGLLEAEQQAVEIDGYDLGGDDRGARVCIGEPARAEIPAAFRRRADVAVNLLRVAPAGARQLGVMPIRFVPWAVAVVPVAVEQRAVGKGHHAPVSRTGSQAPRAFHPEGVLAPELREEACQGSGRVVPGEQAHHREEERRLRTAQIVRPHAVGNVAVGVDQIGEVANHVLDQIMPPTLLQTEHREVRVPVVHLAEPPARDDIRPRRR